VNYSRWQKDGQGQNHVPKKGVILGSNKSQLYAIFTVLKKHFYSFWRRPMPLFKSKKQPEQPVSPRNRAAEHNARARASATPNPQPVPKKSEATTNPPGSDTVHDKRLETILKSGQNAPLPMPTASSQLPASPASQPKQAESPKPEPAKEQQKEKPVRTRFEWKVFFDTLFPGLEKIRSKDFLHRGPPRAKETAQAIRDVYHLYSMAVDAVLLILVLVLAVSLRNLNISLNSVVSDLYESFVLMDNATISTKIQINDAPIPLDFNLPVVQSETNVTLTQPVSIPGAHVTINSGAFLISNAPATVTLPAGTVLPVSLSMDVPVQTTLLVDLEVPVEFALAEAVSPTKGSLHDAFIRLQYRLGPYYCLYQQQLRDTSDPACRDGIFVGEK
jgi:hypothetical protein